MLSSEFASERDGMPLGSEQWTLITRKTWKLLRRMMREIFEYAQVIEKVQLSWSHDYDKAI